MVHERRTSDLRSIVFRPQFEPPPEYRFDSRDTSNAVAPVVGLDLAAGGGRLLIVRQARLYLHLPEHAARLDLNLGRQVFRVGTGVRLRF